jgi:hypothetical protein
MKRVADEEGEDESGAVQKYHWECATPGCEPYGVPLHPHVI